MYFYLPTDFVYVSILNIERYDTKMFNLAFSTNIYNDVSKVKDCSGCDVGVLLHCEYTVRLDRLKLL